MTDVSHHWNTFSDVLLNYFRFEGENYLKMTILSVFVVVFFINPSFLVV